eukprot:15326047-Ditylum_brightwellii.AAC.1
MKLWADEDTLCQPLGKWCKSGNNLDLYTYRKTAPVKVKTTDGTLTWQAFVQQEQCLIATDGSASNNMMSLAWKFVD